MKTEYYVIIPSIILVIIFIIKEFMHVLNKPKGKCLPGALELHKGGYLNKVHTNQFLGNVHRAECDDNPIVYCKAIRASLMALGFDPDWVEDEFRTELENKFIYREK